MQNSDNKLINKYIIPIEFVSLSQLQNKKLKRLIN